MGPEVEHILRVSRIQHGHSEVGEQELRRAGHGRRFCRGIVPDEGDGATFGVGPHEVGVSERIGRTIQARGLAVPESGDAVHPGISQTGRKLRALDRGRGKFFVDARRKDEVVAGEQLGVALKLQVVAAEG